MTDDEESEPRNARAQDGDDSRVRDQRPDGGSGRGWLLYAAGILFGLFTVVYFSFEIVLSLSPTVKAGLLLVVFAGALVMGLTTTRTSLPLVFFALAAISYLGFVLYVWLRFPPGQFERLALLGGSSVLFIGLGYVVRETAFGLDRRTASVLLVGLCLVGVAGIAADAAGPQPTYTVTPTESVLIDSEDAYGQVPVGTLTVENEYALSRLVEFPSYRACAYLADGTRTQSGEEGVQIGEFGDRESVIRGGQTATYTLTVYTWVFANETGDIHDDFVAASQIPVETADTCPSATDGVRLVLAPAETTDS